MKLNNTVLIAILALCVSIGACSASEEDDFSATSADARFRSRILRWLQEGCDEGKLLRDTEIAAGHSVSATPALDNLDFWLLVISRFSWPTFYTSNGVTHMTFGDGQTAVINADGSVSEKDCNDIGLNVDPEATATPTETLYRCHAEADAVRWQDYKCVVGTGEFFSLQSVPCGTTGLTNGDWLADKSAAEGNATSDDKIYPEVWITCGRVNPTPPIPTLACDSGWVTNGSAVDGKIAVRIVGECETSQTQ